MKRKTNLFVLGAQKSGTTTICDLVGTHPEIFVPSVKETYFFCEDSRFRRGEDWYMHEFYGSRKANSAKLLVDGTPFYLASKKALGRISEFVESDARFIIALRHPVERAYSAYWHQKRLGFEPLCFMDALKQERSRIQYALKNGERWWRYAYMHVGFYTEQLNMAFHLLSPERIFILTQQQLKEQTLLVEKLRDFLDLEQAFRPRERHSNPSGMPRSRWIQKTITSANTFKKVVRPFVSREMRSRVGRKILELNSREVQKKPMTDEERSYLECAFRSEIESLKLVVRKFPNVYGSVDSW